MQVYSQNPIAATEAPADEYHMARFVREMDAWVDDLADGEDARLEAEAADGDESDPETWGDEWDADCWVPNDPTFEPTVAEDCWVSANDLADWAEYRRYAEDVERDAILAGVSPACLSGCHELGDLS